LGFRATAAIACKLACPYKHNSIELHFYQRDIDHVEHFLVLLIVINLRK